jgi:RNA polymerase sigma factor (sigma-70 family)
MILHMIPGKKAGFRAADKKADVGMMSLAASGDKSAQRQVVDRLMNRVRSTSLYLAAGHQDAEDYAQMAIIEILRSVGSYRGESSLESWAQKITVRTVMRQIRKRRWRGQFMVVTEDYEGTTDDSAETELSRRRALQQVAMLLGDLKPEVRAVMTMKLVHWHSIPEIAQILETNEHNVRYRLRVGRQKLRRRIRNDPVLREWIGEKRQ